MVTARCRELDRLRMMEQGEEKEKCERIFREPYGKKAYIKENTLGKMRQIFLTKTKMHPFAGNFAKDKRFLKSLWMCFCGWEKEEETHLLSGKCPVYGDLVSLLGDKADSLHLTTFFTAVLERRKRLEEEGEQRSSQPMVAGQGATDIASPTQGQASA